MLFSCGKIGQTNDIPQTSSTSYKEFEAKKAELKEEYNIPQNVKSLSVEDY